MRAGVAILSRRAPGTPENQAGRAERRQEKLENRNWPHPSDEDVVHQGHREAIAKTRDENQPPCPELTAAVGDPSDGGAEENEGEVGQGEADAPASLSCLERRSEESDSGNTKKERVEGLDESPTAHVRRHLPSGSGYDVEVPSG